MRSIKICILIISVFFVSVPVLLGADAASSPEAMFSLGTEAFGNGRYEQALEHFQAAQKAGLDTAALHYNLGVTYYKLKRYSEARQEFEKLVAVSETAPLAHYNLGRIALARGDEAAAKTHFQVTFRTATDETLRMLADDRLRELAAVEQPPRKWSGFASLAAGYDDNVALIADSEVLIGETEDEFLEFIGGVTGQLMGTGTNGLQLKSTGYYQNYLDADEFDFGNFRIGPELDRQFGAWNTSLAGFVDLAYIDHDLFEQIFSTEIQGSREIYPNLVLRMTYQLGFIDAESPYEDLDGNRHRITADLRTYVLGAYTGIGYTLELNDRDDPDFPNRHSVGFLVDKDLTPDWTVGVSGSYRYSDYQETDRQDERLWLTARVARSIPWDFHVFGKYDYIDNYSNVDENEYTSNVFSLGIERFF